MQANANAMIVTHLVQAFLDKAKIPTQCDDKIEQNVLKLFRIGKH